MGDGLQIPKRRRRRSAVALAKSAALANFKPRTALGSELLRLRARIIASGEPMLGWKHLEREITHRRGHASGERA